jgi:putative endonuclease
MTKQFFVYILTNMHNNVFYTRVTSNLNRRIHQHRMGVGSMFTSKYRLCKLVYFEEFKDPLAAIAREKQLKAGSRVKKVRLIETLNPEWVDLYSDDA